MRVLLVDDEPLALELLCNLLKVHQSIEVVGTANNGRRALAAIRDQQPDLVFLDIEMPGVSGFDVVESLQSDDHMPLILFVTAFDKYAVEAFDLSAVDYLLKPVEEGRLQRALLRAMERLGSSSKGDLLRTLAALREKSGKPVSALGEASEEQPETFGRLPVRQGDTVQLLNFEDIDWVDAAGDYMCVHALGDTHILRCTMKQLSDRLAGGPFARIHRSTIVNLKKIEEIAPLAKGECMLHLPDGIKLKVSRNFRSAVQHLLA
ncbi:MAG: LytR/AlgR family response regulator transcription factor [Congregibacter sp.]